MNFSDFGPDSITGEHAAQRLTNATLLTLVLHSDLATPSSSSVNPPTLVSYFYPDQRSPERAFTSTSVIESAAYDDRPQSFTGAGVVTKLTSLIDDYGISKVDASTRIEILNNIRDNAANHYFRACQTKTPAAEGSAEDPKNKKRKADEMASSSKAVPTKKLAVATSTKPAPNVKKEAKPTGEEPTTAKSDSSFFSKPKPRLPNFNKKAPVVVKKDPDPNVAQPSSYNPFREIVASLKSRKDSPSTSTPPSGATLTGAPTATSRQTSADCIDTDKKKSVT
ncbi:hypothetical protein EIP86_010976 [Pleurotus ostreatoroseus]|nr:hypothetical protein EIP86_010976 [Pleurotus ostreatoroseus]